MNLAIITACLYPDRQRIHYLDESCQRQGIFLIPHGIGATFAGWANALVSQTLPAIEDLQREGYTHILFTDGSDSIIIAPEKEIIEKYKSHGMPSCLMSADSECFPPLNGEKFTGPEPWRYVNGGGYIAEIGYFVALVKYLAAKYAADDGNHQSWIVKDWPIPGLVLDHKCTIFQPMDHTPKEAQNGRIVNFWTDEWPCILHFRGGYSDPVTGRDERITPVWRQLYGS